MKRTIISVIFIMMILCISACGKEHVKNETKEVTKEPYELVEEVEKKDEKMSEYEILEMSNYMNGQMTIINGAWMYGVSFNSNGNGVLSKIKSDESELTRLTKYYPTYINVIDGWIYYVANGSNETSIRKVRISGKGEEVIIKCKDKKHTISSMFIYDGKIYYAENKETKNDRITGGFYCTDLKGKNKKTILKKATYFPYIYNDKIYYQDDNDKCKMHVCNMDGSNDKALINNCIYQYIIDGEYIYYKAAKKMPKFNKNKRIVDEESVKYSIYRCNLDGTKDEVVVGSADVIDMAMNKNTIYYTDRNDDFRMYSMDKESGNIDLVTQSNKITNISMFEKGIYYFDYDNKGEYIDHMYYADLDGTSRNEIFGE